MRDADINVGSFIPEAGALKDVSMVRLLGIWRWIQRWPFYFAHSRKVR
jgi:hypothetical protein